MANNPSIRQKVTVWCGFALLCLIESLEWLLPPETTGIFLLQRLGLIYAVTGLAACAVSLLGKTNNVRPVSFSWIVVAGIFFFGIPALLLDLAGGITSSTTVSLLFTIAPVVIVIAVMSHPSEPSEGSELQRLLLPALAGVAGILSILPFRFPDSGLGWLGFAVVLAAVTFSGSAGVWLHRRLQGAPTTSAIGMIGLSNALLLLVWSGLHGALVWKRSQLFQAQWIAGDIVQAAIFPLTVWLVREMSPVRFSARYLVIPLLTISEGLVTMLPVVTVRLVVGVALLAGGAWWLLVSRSYGEERPLSLR